MNTFDIVQVLQNMQSYITIYDWIYMYEMKMLYELYAWIGLYNSYRPKNHSHLSYLPFTINQNKKEDTRIGKKNTYIPLDFYILNLKIDTTLKFLQHSFYKTPLRRNSEPQLLNVIFIMFAVYLIMFTQRNFALPP